jgi:hypothetical protein
MHEDWWNRPTKIMIEWEGQMPEAASWSTFRYELHVANALSMFGKAVDFESLTFTPKGKHRVLFERRQQEFEFGKEFRLADNDLALQKVRPNASVISTLAQLNHRFSTDAVQALNTLVTNIAGLDNTQGQLGYALSFYLQNPDYLASLNRELSRLDLGLEEMKVTPMTPGGPVANFLHVGLNATIPLDRESRGTRRFIEVYPILQLVLNSGGVAVIDELDNDIHPSIIPEVFRWFYDKERNKLGAQLLFAGHNPAILNELEKEQVFFTEKQAGGATRIYGAADIKGLRREPSLMKKYLSGELGAVPHIG